MRGQSVGVVWLMMMLGAPVRAATDDPCAGREPGDPCVRTSGELGACRPDPVRGGLVCGEEEPEEGPPYTIADDDPHARGGDDGSEDDAEEPGGCDHAGGVGLIAALGVLAARRGGGARRSR